jgi:hypothetical protein
LGFLGAGPFRCENPENEGLISLDFLGFSRPNRTFSMGYTGKPTKVFSRRFSVMLRGAGTAARGRERAEEQNCSWADLNLLPVFPQQIVVSAAPYRQRRLL